MLKTQVTQIMPLHVISSASKKWVTFVTIYKFLGPTNEMKSLIVLVTVTGWYHTKHPMH